MQATEDRCSHFFISYPDLAISNDRKPTTRDKRIKSKWLTFTPQSLNEAALPGKWISQWEDLSGLPSSLLSVWCSTSPMFIKGPIHKTENVKCFCWVLVINARICSTILIPWHFSWKWSHTESSKFNNGGLRKYFSHLISLGSISNEILYCARSHLRWSPRNDGDIECTSVMMQCF